MFSALTRCRLKRGGGGGGGGEGEEEEEEEDEGEEKEETKGFAPRTCYVRDALDRLYKVNELLLSTTSCKVRILIVRPFFPV